MAGEFAGKAKFGMIDVDKFEALSTEYKVEFLPTTIVLKDGKVSGTVVGANADEVKAELNKVL